MPRWLLDVWGVDGRPPLAKEVTKRAFGWILFDALVAEAPLRDTNPWRTSTTGVEFDPDYETLQRLLGVPLALNATSQSGVPALAFDVWAAYELRRAGLDPDAVWPRVAPPPSASF